MSTSLSAWFEAQVERDGKSRGRLATPGTVKEQKGMFSVVHGFLGNSGTQTVAYLSYAIGNQARLLTLSGTTAMALLQDVRVLGEVAQQVNNFDKNNALNRTVSNSSAKNSTPNRPVKAASTRPSQP
ncbi:hypothetical protein EON80_29970, partial [bacterium]